MQNVKKLFKGLLATAVCVSSILTGSAVRTSAQEANVNLALNKPVTASAQYHSMPASNLTDNDEASRWSTESAPTQWAYVDLGKEYEMNYFRILWESDQVYAEDYNIYVSNDTENWGEPVVARSGNSTKLSEELLTKNVSGQYVKLEVTKQKGYPSVSACDLKVMLKDENAQDPKENVALNKAAVASSIEAESVRASLAFDGDTSSRSSRWGSDVGNGPHWLYVDLGKPMNVRTIRVFWENRKATTYRLQVADELSDPMTNEDWTDIRVVEDRPADTFDEFVLDEAIEARYVRLYIDSFTAQDPDGGVEWNSVSIYEMEVYGGSLEKEITMKDVLKEIEVTQPTADSEKLEVTLPQYKGYKAEYNGTDFEQVIDSDLTIYKPIVDTVVKASFKVTEEATGKYQFKEVEVTVPGTYTQEETDNEAPVILPELREWKGTTGRFAVSETSRLVVPAELEEMAVVVAEDYKAITGKEIEVAVDAQAQAGDIVFTLTDDKTKGLKKEGYLITAEEDGMEVVAETATGAYWATRTILQSIKATGDYPCGITRDYPLYEIRGFILDVARKPFTLDYLEQFVKEMSWYKMNDFQVHLNDNLIPLEDYTRVGKDPMEAYSAFRLESDVKAGGNNGLNKQDLTSTDVFYTKDEFRNFIKESRVQGVNIVPEIDTPAHSLALTKVRPDLRHGLSGRNNDHLALRDKYDECIEFVKSIFGEYMGETNPVFDEETIVQVGADEYNADAEAYRRFSDDMLGYVQDTGRTARIWGSLSQCRGTTPVRSEGVQMNLWNFGYANMDEMYELGYDLINCNDGNYYIVPAAGYYYDYLYDGTMYNLPINSIGGVTIPAGDDQMKGGAFAVWNDMTDYLNNGMTEYDIYDRSSKQLALFAAKLWGKGSLSMDEAKAVKDAMGDAPNTDFGYKVDTDENGVAFHETMDDVQGVNAASEAVDGKVALKLNGNESYITTPIETAGLGNDLRVKVKRTSASTEEQILFESDYGTIKAVQKDTGKVGFSREMLDFSFNYELPVGEWVELEFKNRKDIAELYVNGVLVDVLGDGDKTSNEMADLTGNYKTLHATTMFPLAKIGSETNAFIGYVEDVRLGVNAEYNSTMELDHAAVLAELFANKYGNADLRELVAQANVLLAQFAPEAAAVEELTAQINAVIDTIDFEKADYSRIEKYLSLIPSDLSVFTSESVENLNKVVNSIPQNLPVEMQEVVDGYEILLENAIHALAVKSEGNVNYVDHTTLKATASSNQPGEGPEKAIDNDPNTMWHVDWNNNTLPHWIDLEMQELTSVNALTYVPRSNAGNGTLKKYEIYVSENGVDYEKVAEGTVAQNANAKVIEFPSVTTKHVRLQFIDAVGGFGSAAEIKLHLSNVAADIEGLNAVIADAEAIVFDGYTSESWEALQTVIASAKELAANADADANDVENMKRELSAKMAGLTLEERGEAPAKVYTVTLDGEVFFTGEYNAKVTLTAPVVEGKEFTGWSVNGKVVSTDETYTFFLSEDTEVVTCYEEVKVEASAVLTNTLLTKRADKKADAKFVGQLVLPEGYTIKNAGLVWSSKEGTELSLENTNLKPTYINTISTSNQFSVTIKGMPAGRFIRGKIFATLVDGEGNETVVYSEEGRLFNY